VGGRGVIGERDQTIIIGAGIGGLVSALLLAARGVPVAVVEAADVAGGKIRQLDGGGAAVDAGPTVFTMRDVFDQIFEAAGTSLDAEVRVTRAERIARHAWDASGPLDLYADSAQSEQAIGDFAGAEAARGYRSFAAEARRIFAILDRPFLRGPKVLPPGLMWRIGLWRFADLLAIRPYESLWKVLHEHFRDPRLIQLFGRYSTYCGSVPMLTPATLMLIAHVEAQGVWAIDGGMTALAAGLERVARAKGAKFRFGAPVARILTEAGTVSGVDLASGERLAAGRVIFNGDPAALGGGLLGSAAAHAVRPVPPKARSLSALVWLVNSRTHGLALDHHNVFFSPDYPREFADIAARGSPASPTAYVCALDRGGGRVPAPGTSERLQIIVNARASGDTHIPDAEEKARCTSTMLERLKACGLELDSPLPHQLLTPADFAARFPGTGGALYGRASHGWAASFLRPGSRTAIPGLYCAGGATHPGAGVPMAALSGMLASEALLADLASTPWYRRRATAGGISTRSAMTNATG
jgi:1-hydroxycarotenoid 3,4-desaturase